jgi:hypothetical protein
MCRKAHGAAFATYVGAPAEGLRWVSGQDRVARYESSPGFYRPFCSRCGSVVAGDPAEGRVFLPAGCLDGDPGVRPGAHIFVASKAPWHEIADDLPRFDTYPPGVEAPEVPPRAPPPPAREGAVRGSCLCGGVAYEVEGELYGIVNCHCSRCRKARSAAHASNLFAGVERLRWTQGEDRIGSFRVPEAKRFRSSFCRVCGASLPRAFPERGFAVIPAGTLDDDPGARERFHIFCGSKAPWYEIADDVPQFEEYEPGRG